MKYEIIGWTSCDNARFPWHSPLTPCVELAVRRELAEHGYCFGGDRHEEYCPVLCDGTLVSLSWRGWGGLMARARGENGDFNYMRYYMNALIAPGLLKYPKEGVQAERIVPRLALAERFPMHLNDAMFDAMSRGKKRVEFRLLDDKRRVVDVGDYIEFYGSGGRLLKRVCALFTDTDFEKIFGQLTNRSYGNKYCAEDFGSPAGTDAAAFAQAMAEIYPPERQTGGVIAFALEDALPRYSVSLHVWTDERFDLLERYLTVDEIDALPLMTDHNEAEKALEKIAPFARCAGGFRRFGEGTDFGETVGEVLGELMGKEDALHALAKRLGLAFSLEVTALFPDAPPMAPVLDAAAEQFLRKINAYVHISPIALP